MYVENISTASDYNHIQQLQGLCNNVKSVMRNRLSFVVCLFVYLFSLVLDILANSSVVSNHRAARTASNACQ